MQDTQPRTGEYSYLPVSEQHFTFFLMQDTLSRTGENFQLPSYEQHLTFFTCRIPSPGQEKILSYLPLLSHAGYPVQDRRKFLATFLFFHMQDAQSRTGENS
jgi:hypothetical protein